MKSIRFCILLTIPLFGISQGSFGQYDISPKKECLVKIIHEESGIIMATAKGDCDVIDVDKLKNGTWLVFTDEKKKQLLYSVNIIDGVKEGTEIFYSEKEKDVINYLNGIREGSSYTFYETGEIKYKREFRNGKVYKFVYEYNKDGSLKRKIAVNKHGEVIE